MEEESYYEENPFVGMEKQLKADIRTLEEDMQFIRVSEVKSFAKSLLLQKRADLIEVYMKYAEAGGKGNESLG
jgi:hypothetical protein